MHMHRTPIREHALSCPLLRLLASLQHLQSGRPPRPLFSAAQFPSGGIWAYCSLCQSLFSPRSPKTGFFHSWLKAPFHQAVRGNSIQHSRRQPASPCHRICFITSRIGTSRHLRSSPFSCSVCPFASLGRALTLKGSGLHSATVLVP